MKLNILILSLLFSMNIKAECLNQKNYEYDFKYDKNNSVVDINVKKKDGKNFYVYGDVKNNGFNIWYEVKENEMTINSNIKNRENEQWFNDIFFKKYNKKELIELKSIHLEVSLKEWIKENASIRYLNEDRKIIPYLVIFQDESLNCAYFEGTEIIINMGKISYDNKKNKFIP